MVISNVNVQCTMCNVDVATPSYYIICTLINFAV